MTGRLINKTYRDYAYLSRYSDFPYYYDILDNKYVYSTSKPLRKDISHTLHVVEQGDTLDTLALDYYNNPTLFWVIAYYNDINDVFEPLKVGESLSIPALSEVSFNNR